MLVKKRCRYGCVSKRVESIGLIHPHTLKPPFLCRWASCQRQFSMEQERDVHLERHTIRPLPCPFAGEGLSLKRLISADVGFLGCNEQFDKPVEVMQHEVQHQKADRRELLIHKPTCQPIVPGIPARLGPPPQWLPSHRVIPRRVAKCQISADRHAIVGPWVRIILLRTRVFESHSMLRF